MKQTVDKKILEELQRFDNIRKYIYEQDVASPPTIDDMPPMDNALGDTADAPPADGGGSFDDGVDEVPEPVDIQNDPDVEVVDDTTGDVIPTDDMGDGTEELDITDLVNSQQEMATKQDEYMDTIFNKLDDLEQKLAEMDNILNKINTIEAKIDKYRQKTPEEKLELRSLDSYPYNQKLSDFFEDKTQEMEASGKNEYILTPDDVDSFSERDIKKRFDTPFEDMKRF